MPVLSTPVWHNGCQRAPASCTQKKNDSWRLSGERHTDPVRFIQMWVTPDDSGIDPGYQQREIGNELLSGGLVTVASGMPQHRDQTAITIAQKNAALHAARIAAGDSVEPPPRSSSISSSPRSITVEAVGELTEGDALRLTDIGAVRVTAIRDAEILVWEMHTRLGG